MAALTDDQALGLVAAQGLGSTADYGPNAPSSLKAVMEAVHATRERGFAMTEETYTPGLNAMGAVVRLQGQAPLGAITIAGPSVRFTRDKMEALGAELQSVAGQMAAASGASPFFNQRLHHLGQQAVAQPIYAA
jgi:DNA-binding IclR family transcriptional regulator